MKKSLVFLLVVLTGICHKAIANNVTVYNLTNATYTVAYYNMGPNPILTLVVPPYSDYHTSYLGFQDALFCKVIIEPGRPVTSWDMAIAGIGFPYSDIPNYAHSIDTYPFLGGNFFNISWSQASPTTNAFLLIY